MLRPFVATRYPIYLYQFWSSTIIITSIIIIVHHHPITANPAPQKLNKCMTMFIYHFNLSSSLPR